MSKCNYAAAVIGLNLVLASALHASQIHAAESDSVFPGAQWPAVQLPGDWDIAALEDVFSYAQAQHSSGLVIVRHGRLVAERYWTLAAAGADDYQRMRYDTTADGRSLEDVASVQKSVVSFLVAVAVKKGLIDIEAPVSAYLSPGWSGAKAEAEKAIRVRHLLTMTSGLAPDLSPEARPGERWRYNTRAYSRLVKVLETVAGLDINTLTRQWLTGPIGMQESEWRPRLWVDGGLDANSIGFVTSARDLGRFGLLMLGQGTWAGGGLQADAGYLKASTRPSQDLNPAYGFLWWLNGQSYQTSERSTGELIPAAPADLYAAQGALGRKLYVIPSLDLVVARLGAQPEADFNQQFWLRLMAALPAE